ncbi:hypothetical protein OHA79_39420 [Streptomyces sp. NBC_00841]|uniref:hypothetical protein n=1 Tax=unclassified Streptomyces TaxID=2593676 RepID=UPI002259E222|nr:MULTISPECIES: hypothetical protein [unclassified Streptomyces]MCX4530893.1 hypothetical protein [Streptomyces sp. NBC_01669]WSA03361.1 hypothetical protein OHA79_39420 [Streptomyces sp. NBC_00841]
MQFSCQLLFRREAEFVDHFYACMLAVVPGVRELAPQHGRPLCDGLVRSVLWAALTQDTPEVVEATLRRVGASHQRQGFPEAWYRSSGRALLDAAHEIHKGDWGSLLSSHWIAYYTWLSKSLTSGAATARSQPGHAEALGHTAGSGAAGDAHIESLGDVVAELRTRYFPEDQRALAAICTRVALRTGADLRNPRPDQHAEPAVVRNVLNILLVLGYSLGTYVSDRAAPRASPHDEGAVQAPDRPLVGDTDDGQLALADGMLRRWKRLFSKANR